MPRPRPTPVSGLPGPVGSYTGEPHEAGARSSHQAVFPYGPCSTPHRSANASTSDSPRPDSSPPAAVRRTGHADGSGPLTVRNSKRPEGPALAITVSAWTPFVEAVKAS
ncbi:DUF397 domain-containing protein [Streptomyces atratus]|uniref:DUF397 domain-containing protein n=1 Tax=Streptomyces atratus TaxID=1893 RepID=UPI003F69A3EA